MKRITIDPTPIENVVVKYYVVNEGRTVYLIEPLPGYVMHDNEEDWVDEAGIKHMCYRASEIACVNYDFSLNQRDFYAIPETEVLADVEM